MTKNNYNKKEIKLESSKVVWKGYKNSNLSFISMKSGHLNFDKDIFFAHRTLL